MKKRIIGPVIGAVLALGIVLGACTAPVWSPAEREELGEPRLVGAEHRPAPGGWQSFPPIAAF